MNYRNYINVSVVLIAGIGLLAMALPRFKASINQFPVDHFFVSINDDQLIPRVEQIPSHIQISKDSISMHETSGYWEDLANLWLHKAQIQGSIGSQSISSLHNAENAARQSLLLSPANSFLSYQLAVIIAVEKTTPSEIANLLILSIMSSPYEPGFMRHRLDFCLMYFSAFQEHDYPYLVTQLSLFWVHSQNELIALLNSRTNYLNSVIQLLKNTHPELLKELLIAVKDV